jgi:hypothetical protein
MDFDPRWNDDPRDDDHRDDLRREESGRELNQGSRGVSSDPLERDARDPRDVFTRDLDLPRGPDRERVWFREHSVLLRGSESRALATTGAFRVVHADDLRDNRGQAYDPRSGELRHLREQKLVRTIPIRDGLALVVLTERAATSSNATGTSASSTSTPAFSAHASYFTTSRSTRRTNARPSGCARVVRSSTA